MSGPECEPKTEGMGATWGERRGRGAVAGVGPGRGCPGL